MRKATLWRGLLHLLSSDSRSFWGRRKEALQVAYHLLQDQQVLYFIHETEQYKAHQVAEQHVCTVKHSACTVKESNT